MSYHHSTVRGPSAGTPHAGGPAVAPPPPAPSPPPPLGTNTGIAALGTSGGMEHKSRGLPVARPVRGGARNADASGSALVMRYALQAVARSWLPEERVAFCMRGVRAPLVSLYCSPARRSASLGGLLVCGSVWNCPVCAAKVAERRRAELVAAMRTWTEGGGVVLVAALTFSHGPRDALEPMLERFLGAYRRMWQNKAGRTLRERFGVEHSVRALEVTHGDTNGWHPHAHLLLFLRGAVDVGALEDALYHAWEQAARASGLSMTRERGLDLQPATDGAALYVAKWGHEPERRAWEAPDEMVKANSKRGRDGRRTPFDLLRAGLAGEDAHARLLFREFAAAFKGRHQLQPSRGAWAALGVKTRTDEEVALAKEGDAYLLALLERHEFRVIVGNDAVPELLLSARDGDLEAVNAFLADLGLPPREPLVAAVRAAEVEDEDDDGDALERGSPSHGLNHLPVLEAAQQRADDDVLDGETVVPGAASDGGGERLRLVLDPPPAVLRFEGGRGKRKLGGPVVETVREALADDVSMGRVAGTRADVHAHGDDGVGVVERVREDGREVAGCVREGRDGDDVAG